MTADAPTLTVARLSRVLENHSATEPATARRGSDGVVLTQSRTTLAATSQEYCLKVPA